MPKILLYADLHIHAHRGDSKRIEDGLNCLCWIYENAVKHNVNNIVFAGDFFHHRFSLSAYAYAKACSIIDQYVKMGYHTTMLLGNHDCYYEDNWSVNSLCPLKNVVTLVDRPQTITFGKDKVDFLPYTPHPSQYLTSLNSRILISHLAVADATLNPLYDIKSVEDDSSNKEIISASAFNKWDKVWLGHYHYAQKLGKVEYIGSPMQLTFGEANQKKHIVIFDTSSLNCEYIENTQSPKFIIINDINEIPENIEQSYLQIRSDLPLDDKFEIKKKFAKLGIREIEFCNSVNNVIQENTSSALQNISSLFNNKEKLLDEFLKVTKLPDNINVGKLKSIALKLINDLK